MPRLEITSTSRVLSGVAIRPILHDIVISLHHGNTQQNHRRLSWSCDKRSGSGNGKVLTMDNINPNIVAIDYAVRGPIVTRASEIQKELAKGVKKPFKKVVKLNLGDCHALGQKPITFIRQVLACTACPSIIDKADFPNDVKERARGLLSAFRGRSVGSYTESTGIELARRRIAEYIERRDGYKANCDDIAISGGATTAIKHVLPLFYNDMGGKQSSVMISIPRYPLYSAALSEFGLGQTGYYLDEDHNWGLPQDELERSYAEGSQKYNVRAIVIINPGNPTGQVLSRENIEIIIKFAHAKKLFILADEVYQDNVYAKGSEFHSFKKVMSEMGKPYNKMELASFMSVSKGYMGECGLRGGWVELWNIDPGVQANLYKAMSAMLCCSSLAQVAVDCVARPPREGEPSYELFIKEKSGVLGSLAERAQMVAENLNKINGYSCNVVQGAMYAFPQIKMPPKAIAAAKSAGKKPDQFYASKLLEETGICVVPGSGFGQKPGTWHFRTTILAQPTELKGMLDIIKRFHEKFIKEYAKECA